MTFAHENTPKGEPIYVMKNLRVCPDCHEWSKLISLKWERQCIVRDANRLHVFENGKCSCSDFW